MLIERLCLISGAKVGSGLRDGCWGEPAACGDGLEQQPGGCGSSLRPKKAGEAGGKHSREITPGKGRSESQTQNSGRAETWPVPVW